MTADKKIFHIIPSLRCGGAERLLVEIVSLTTGENFSHTVCNLKQAGFFAPEISRSGCEVLEFDLPGKRPWFSAARKLSSVIGERRPDLVVSWLYDATIASRLALLGNRNLPLLTTLHTPDYEPEVIKAGNWPPRKVEILRLLDKATAKLTRPFFVACSNFVASSYKKRLGVDPSKIRVIHNFIDPGSLLSEDDEVRSLRQSLEIPAEDFVFLNVGRLDPQKGQIYLLQAFSRVLEAAPSARLVIVGPGELENSLKETAKALNIASRVHFLGRRSDIGVCLEMADAFVFPSLAEGLGIALVEAMSKKLPCIASRLEVFEEVIDDEISGLFVEPASAGELAAAMIRIYNDPELREKLGNEAFKKTEERFSSKVQIPKWENLFREISEN